MSNPSQRKRKTTQANRHPTIPLKYAGKWIAWNYDHTKIVASGDTSTETRQAAIAKGELRSWLDRVPDPDTFYTGPALQL